MSLLTIALNPAIDRVLECPDFHIGGHQQVREIARLAAGKAPNVSRALAQLGSDSIATGFIGTHEVEFFHNQLLECGPGRILCHFIEVGGKTRENITILDSQRHIETHLRNRGFTIVEAEIDLLEKKLTHDLRPGDTAIFSGSLCEGITPQRYAQIVQHARAAGALLAVDASGPALAELVKHKLWLIKPNLAELAELLGTALTNDPIAIAAKARPLLHKVDHILISRGPDGALLLNQNGLWSASAPPDPADTVVRTVGCGDHLLAGFIAEFAAGSNLESALRTAVALATARALSPSLEALTPEEIQNIAPRIITQKLASA